MSIVSDFNAKMIALYGEDFNVLDTPEEVIITQRKRIHAKGVKFMFTPLLVPQDNKFSMVPLRLFLGENNKFETLFWVKCLYLLNQWRPFDKDGNPIDTSGFREGSKTDTDVDAPLDFVWYRIKEIDSNDELLPKYIVGSSTKCRDRIIPRLVKEDKEKCIFLVDSLFDGVKSTSTLVLKSLIQFHQIVQYDQLVYWVDDHGLLPLYGPNLNREWIKLTQ